MAPARQQSYKLLKLSRENSKRLSEKVASQPKQVWNEVADALPQFAVPAVGEVTISCALYCAMSPQGIECQETRLSPRCPPEIDIAVPNGPATTAPIKCGPPRTIDAGEIVCDCEFPNG